MKKLQWYIMLVLVSWASTHITAQEDDITYGYSTIKGMTYPIMIDENGDTLIIATLSDVSLSSVRKFESRDERVRYEKYKRYAAKVYPYAAQAIRIFREMEHETKGMKKRKRKKYIKKLQKELKVQFEEPLTNLSKTQGKILVEMIERELDTSMYDLIKELNGRFKAFYWNQSSKLYGYRIKDKYEPGQNHILDLVLSDLNISYQVE